MLRGQNRLSVFYHNNLPFTAFLTKKDDISKKDLLSHDLHRLFTSDYFVYMYINISDLQPVCSRKIVQIGFYALALLRGCIICYFIWSIEISDIYMQHRVVTRKHRP